VIFFSCSRFDEILPVFKGNLSLDLYSLEKHNPFKPFIYGVLQVVDISLNIDTITENGSMLVGGKS